MTTEPKATTWQERVPFLVATVASDVNPEHRKEAAAELMKLAKIIDDRIGALKELKEKQAATCPDCGGRNGVHCYGCPETEAPVT
jgi:hypothetical protein